MNSELKPIHGPSTGNRCKGVPSNEGDLPLLVTRKVNRDVSKACGVNAKVFESRTPK